MGDAERFADAFRRVTLASERLLLCVSGCDVDDARLAADALKKLARVKLQMHSEHQIAIARFHDSRLIVLQEFTRAAERLSSALDCMAELADERSAVSSSMDDLLRDAGQYFASCDPRQAVFRLVVLCRHEPKTPEMCFVHGEATTAFLAHTRFHLDAIYWHTDISSEQAQSTFDQLCTFEPTNPFAKAYFLDVGGSIERLFQSLALVLSHPAHRPSQVAAEDLVK